MNLLLRKTEDRSKPNRRDFMVQSTCATLGITSAVNTLSQLSLIGAASKAHAAGGVGDFKALVCLFLNGGNDSNNLLIPTGATGARTDYEFGRGIPGYAGGTGGLAVPLGQLTSTAITADNPSAFEPTAGYTNNNFALHPACVPLKTLFDQGDLAFVANVGTLVGTTPVTRANFNSLASAAKPPQLFSHADQQTQWQSSLPDRPFTSGWGGKLADYLVNPSGGAFNSNSAGLAIGVSLSGVNSFQVGVSEQPYAVSTSGATPFSSYNGGSPSTNYGAALTNTALKPFVTGVNGYDPLVGTAGATSNYQATQAGWRLRALEQLMAMNHANLFDAEHELNSKSARLTEGLISDALKYTDGTNGPSLDTYFTAAFGSANAANTDFANQLKMIARLIIGNKKLLQLGQPGNDRMVFFSQQGGYDTHTSQIATNTTNTAVNTAAGQYTLLDVLSKSVKAFYDSIIGAGDNLLGVGGGAGLWNDVLGFTASDFTRTLTPNKTDSSGGSDHAWGGHAFLVGGAVKGKKIYGTFPYLKVGGPTNDPLYIDCTGNRGRWIPSTSVDQYASRIAQWMGVPANSQTMADIFPNLSRFAVGTNLDMIDYAV